MVPLANLILLGRYLAPFPRYSKTLVYNRQYFQSHVYLRAPVGITVEILQIQIGVMQRWLRADRFSGYNTILARDGQTEIILRSEWLCYVLTPYNKLQTGY